MIIYPLLFSQVLLEKVWGGHSINRLKNNENTLEKIGESWEIHTQNVIVNGEYTGKTLQELIDRFPLEMTGRRESMEFPLLVKLLDTQEWLSVQVHPDDALAIQLEGEPRGKTECWYILHAEPNAKIQYDFKNRVSIADYAESIQKDKPIEHLQFLEVKAGDIIYVPAGTVHAIGPGIMLYELQQTSDTTYRLYDWDRAGLDGKPRELHIEKGLKCSRPGAGKFPYPSHPIHEDVHGNARQILVKEQYFILEKITLHSRPFHYDMHGKAILITNIGDHDLHIISDGAIEILPPSHSAFVPAGLHNVTFHAANAAIDVLIASENAS